MKLRNKKTGETIDLDIANIKAQFGRISVIPEPAVLGSPEYVYTSLAELNAEWEDYEETKYYYAITSIKADDGITKMKNKHNDMTAFDKSIGNYFETKEEAQEAVEKLKAWKRLKEKGFEFDGIRLEGSNCLIKTKLQDNTDVTFNQAQQFYEDVVLLFGGEE